MPTWTHLLGLPLDQAAMLLGDVAHRVVPTCAPKRENAKAPETVPDSLTLRVIRVKDVDGMVELIVSGFPDGDPKKP